jgi:phage tail-like protein
MSFQQVSGLNVQAQPIEYGHGDNSSFSALKMPGGRKYGTVILKKGVFVADNALWDWFSLNKTNAAQRTTVTVSLLDEAGLPKIVWTLANAWPTKITGTDRQSTGNEVAVETIELAHEGITMAGG